MGVAAAMTATIAKLLQPIMDDVLGDGDERMIVPFALMVMCVFIVRGISTYAHTVLMNIISHSVVARIQQDLFAHFVGLDLAFFHKNPSGQLISRVVQDVSVMRVTVADIFTNAGKGHINADFPCCCHVFTKCQPIPCRLYRIPVARRICLLPWPALAQIIQKFTGRHGGSV